MNIIPNRNDVLFPIEVTLNKFFDDFFNNKHSILSSAKANAGYPKLNYYQTDEKICMVFAVPGINKEDLEIEYNQDNTLTVRGKMNESYSESNANYFVRELRTSSFSRTVVLPGSSLDKPTAKLENGLLILEWTLAPPKPKAKQLIEIK